MDLLQGQAAQPHGRQLDRQGDSVEPVADLADQRGVSTAQGEVLLYCRGPLDKEGDSVTGRGARRDRRPLPGQRERWYFQDGLARNVERLWAGREDAQVRNGAQQLRRHGGGRVDQVLAVVEHQQQPLAGEELGESRDGLEGLEDAEGVSHSGRYQPLVGDIRELDQPHSAWERSRRLCGDPQSEAGLANPAGPGECHHPTVGEQLPAFCEFAAPSHEAGQLGGQPPRFLTQNNIAHTAGPQQRCLKATA